VEAVANQDKAFERRRQHLLAAYASRFRADSIRGEFETKHENLALDFLTSNHRISCLQLLPPDIYYDADLMGKPSEWAYRAKHSNSFTLD
jgi:hypothetical protein